MWCKKQEVSEAVAKKMAGLCAVFAKTKEFRELQKDLLDDLTARGLISKPYMDKVEEYMGLWCLRRMLEEDIAARGRLCGIPERRQPERHHRQQERGKTGASVLADAKHLGCLGVPGTSRQRQAVRR